MRRFLAAVILSLILTIGLAPGLALALSGSGLATGVPTETSKTIAVQADKAPEVTITNAATDKVAIKIGKSYNLGAKTSEGKLTYQSSNKKVATVSSKGIVKAKKIGKATITVTAKGDSKEASKKVSVTVLSAKEYKDVEKIKANVPIKLLKKGETTKVKVTFSPSKPSNNNVIYKSSNPKVLTVSAAGQVKAIKDGKAKVTVTSCDNAKATASITIEVEPSYPLNRSKWEARMHLPTDKQVNGYRAKERSPYIVCWPDFSGTNGFTEYAVDFKADSQPRGTYLNIGYWSMDLSSLRSRYASVATDNGDSDPGAGYAGFQVLEDGSKVAIMSIWKLCLTDKNGKKSTHNAKRTYPKNPRISDDFGGEGTGVKTMVDYDWKTDRSYRALIKCGSTASGNCELQFWVCDLKTKKWTKLIAYDLGYKSSHMTSMGCFLENFDIKNAGEVRTVEWSNFRAKSRKTGTWVSTKSAKLERQFEEWTGSYNYGSDASSFWAVATGVPNLNDSPTGAKRFSVSKAQEGAPYEKLP